MTDDRQAGGGLLDLIERAGNRLPDPATLFLIGTVLVMAISAVAAMGNWKVVEKLPVLVTETVTAADGTTREVPVLDENGKQEIAWPKTGKTYTARSLLTRDGLFWAISSMVDNFVKFPPLGVVLVGMLGIGIAERTGFIGALLKALAVAVPNHLLTPTMVFLGIMSSMTLDAGYVILPPLAAALYKAVGRSPLAGLAAVFAGVSAGFNANLFITALDPMLAGFANTGGQVIDPDYQMNPACNWYFMMASTVVITLVGWGVTRFFVERRLQHKPPDEGGPVAPTAEDLAAQQLRPEEKRSMTVALAAFAVALGLFLSAILIPGAPLYTYKMPAADSADPDNPRMVAANLHEMAKDETAIPEGAWLDDANDNGVYDNGELVLVESDEFDRWVDSIVPILFICFIVPGVAYGISIGNLRNDKDVAKLMVDSMAYMAPIIVLAFVAAQFIEYFKYSGMDRMLAMWGGQTLGQAQMPMWALIVAFIGLTMTFNMFIGSMSAKYAMFAPIFIPMFMLVGIAPELTQAAYRIGDSVTNIITPLNAYLIIILVFMQKFVPKGGMGTLISTMLPYTVAFAIVWTIMLLIWVKLGIPLGPDGYLEWAPPTG